MLARSKNLRKAPTGMARLDMLPTWAAAPPPAAQAFVLVTAEDGVREQAPFGDKAGLLIGRNGQVTQALHLPLRSAIKR